MTQPRVRPPLRSAAPTTSPPLDGGEEMTAAMKRTLPLPPTGGEVASQSDDGVGEISRGNRSRRRSGVTKRARNLRQGDNESEALLWLELKRRKLGGYKFTRQFPIGSYFADFCCREQRLVVEIDGSQHAENPHDRKRDEFMRAHGYSVLRFWNTDVLRSRISVCETILAALDGRLAASTKATDLRFVFAESTSAISGGTS